VKSGFIDWIRLRDINTEAAKGAEASSKSVIP
jgi:hypothetical protein